MTQLIVDEIVGAGVEQEFTTTQNHSIERIRCHVCFINIDNATNPGSITLDAYDSVDNHLGSKTYTFAEIITACEEADAAFAIAHPGQTRDTLQGALESTSRQWHGYLSFTWDQPLNIRPGVYTLLMTASYNYVTDTNYIGWIKEHDDMKYATYDETSFPTLTQEEVPHSFEVYTYTKISDF